MHLSKSNKKNYCLNNICIGLFVIFMSSFALAADRVEQRYPNVIAVKVSHDSGNLYNFDVTVSSPYDTPQRYADAFRVTDKTCKVLGERKLLHDHEDEQPFMRDLYGVSIPKGVRSVVVEARDQKFGYGGAKLEAILPDR